MLRELLRLMPQVPGHRLLSLVQGALPLRDPAVQPLRVFVEQHLRVPVV